MNDIKTARQAGWSMGESHGLITLYNDYGDYAEVYANVDGILKIDTKDNIALGDLPRSVLNLICLWLDVVNSF